MIHRYVLGVLAVVGLVDPAAAYDVKARVELEPLIAKHAKANNVPAALVHRVIIRESRYNPRAVGHGGALGLMQIKHGTARALGYSGPPAGLLDADTNLTYAVRYLAGAYRVADGDHTRAVGFYARGYYYDAKRRGGMQKFLASRSQPEEPVVVAAAEVPPKPAPSLFDLIFAGSFPNEPTPEQAQPAPEDPEEPAPAPPTTRAGKRTAALIRTAPSTAAPAARSESAAKPVATPSPRLPKAKAAAVVEPAGDAIPAAGEPHATSSQPAAQDSKAPVPPRRAAPAQKAKPVVKPVSEEAAAQSDRETTADAPEATGTPSAKRSARPARPSGASGANRPAQRASARPDDPDRHP